MSQCRIQEAGKADKEGQINANNQQDSPGTNSDMPIDSESEAGIVRRILPYHEVHPPSPKVSKGPNVKKTVKTATPHDDLSSTSALSSDIHMRLSGIVDMNAQHDNSDVWTSTTDPALDSNVSRGKAGETKLHLSTLSLKQCFALHYIANFNNLLFNITVCSQGESDWR